eukprot:4958580-Alexandrium_andersonii.AAC.1
MNVQPAPIRAWGAPRNNERLLGAEDADHAIAVLRSAEVPRRAAGSGAQVECPAGRTPKRGRCSAVAVTRGGE